MHGLRTTLLRCLFPVTLIAAVGLSIPLVFAQSAAPPPPPPQKLEPLPEIPPPPGVAGDPDLEPQITIRRNESGETIEEARVNGQLKWIKVTPRHGRPYFLIPDAGGRRYVRSDSLDY